MESILQREYWGNSIQDYLIALGIFIGIIIAIRIFRSIILSRLKKFSANTTSNIDDILIQIVEKSILPIVNVAAVYAALHYLTLSARTSQVARIALSVVMTYFAIKLITTVLSHILTGYMRRQDKWEEKQTQVKGIMIVVNIVVWALGIVFLLDNLGFDITAVITGLGIGGVAIALASQAILADLFSYFVIFFDRPFELGDFVVVDDKNGIVEHVGVKTTRIKTLSGEQLVFSNTDLTNSRIHNYKKMARRRVLFKIGIVYNTDTALLKEAPGIIKEIIVKQENATFDRSHFMNFGNFSLDIETVYFIESPDYNIYMDIHQAVLTEIFETFNTKGISFAFPTQTLFMENMGGNGKDDAKKSSATLLS
ncbi:mechanosensitive ion channel family protein [Parasegetibacter sp. NRK P23]|uniref:mechanosensitive ion channel family protein n=1 Tax=Parasegetibacter sp. NRK P23 TaxID=2942999 RepID=UPI0020437915|nr:mechanosensitive ion channel family protein [Parasegetibacter sp. NRK P23]MCM5528172.1 mechanosensitive ion channel family protein [Parasegetibacter sp. NRK P23]